MTEAKRSLEAQHETEVNFCVKDIRSMISSNGVTRSTLSEVKARLLELRSWLGRDRSLPRTLQY